MMYCVGLGSRDNISAVVVKLPGAKVGPLRNGGVAKRRQLRVDAKGKSKLDDSSQNNNNSNNYINGLDTSPTSSSNIDSDKMREDFLEASKAAIGIPKIFPSRRH